MKASREIREIVRDMKRINRADLREKRAPTGPFGRKLSARQRRVRHQRWVRMMMKKGYLRERLQRPAYAQ